MTASGWRRSRNDPRPNKLILSGYGPLAGVIAVLLVVMVTVPSKAPSRSDNAAQAAAAPGDYTAAAVPGAEVAGVPAAVTTMGKAGKPAKGSKGATTPGMQTASAPAPMGLAPAANCAGGTLQVAGSVYSPACVNFTGNNGGATSRGVTADTITVAIRASELGGGGGDDDKADSDLEKKAEEAGISASPADRKRELDTLVDCTTLMNSAVDLIAKRFPAGSNAVRAGSAAMREKPRKFGLLVPDDVVYAQCIKEARPKLDAAGITFTKEIRYGLEFAKLQQEAPNMAAQLKAAGVTTLVLVTDPLLPFFLTGAATQQDYYPEWFVSGTIGTDADVAGQFYDSDQWQFAYGQSYLTGFGSGKTSEAYKAFASMKNGSPTSLVDLTYQTLMMLFIGLQNAGPNLTPQTYAQGMLSYGKHTGTYGQWSFSPTDYTSTDDAREFYYDPKALSPFDNRPGRCVPVGGGKRYIGASWPATTKVPIPPAVVP